MTIDWKATLQKPILEEPLIQPAAVVCGVDPGVDGAIAVLWGFEDGVAGFKPVDVVPMPWKGPRKIDWGAVRHILALTARMAEEREVPIILGVEIPFHNPEWAAYTYGFQVTYAQRVWGIAYGLWISVMEVEVRHWQKEWLPMKIRKDETTKQRAARVVKRIYGCDIPSDNGQADAVCIAHHTWSKLWSNKGAYEKLKNQTSERRASEKADREAAKAESAENHRHGRVVEPATGAGANQREGIQPASAAG